jgi:hypothetical protein
MEKRKGEPEETVSLYTLSALEARAFVEAFGHYSPNDRINKWWSGSWLVFDRWRGNTLIYSIIALKWYSRHHSTGPSTSYVAFCDHKRD